VIIAADIGGTKTHVALLDSPKDITDASRKGVFVASAKYPSAQYPGLTAILADFMQRFDVAPRGVKRVCAGIAGPVVEGRVETPNLPWDVDAAELRASLGTATVTLMNDLEATAERAATLSGDDVFVLNEGRRPSGSLTNGAVIAAGTGLGMAVLHPIGGAWWPVASEGGHVDLAPKNELEMDLLRFLLGRHRRVSVERVVSGPGLLSLYEFFLGRAELTPSSEVLAQVRAPGADGPAIVSDAALERRCPVASNALDQFVAFYGAAAGNLGLMAVSTGGMFVGGGIAPKIIERLKSGLFMEAFTFKGRLSPLLEAMPVYVILDPDAALHGAARRAMRLELGLISQ
jgi:glucokinase